MREQDLGTYQMLWDCPSCGTEKLLGVDHRHCPNCGAAQDPTRRYFPAEHEKVAARDHRYTGADIACPACETPCARSANNCANCGSPLAGGKEVMRRSDQVASAGGGFAADSAKLAGSELKERRAAEKAALRGELPAGLAAVAPKKSSSLVWVAVAAVVGLIVLAIVFFTWKKEVEVEAVGHAWSRSIDIEEYRRVRDSAWRDQLPSGAHEVSCRREERSTKKVPDGETCRNVRKDQGNGTYKEVRECEPKYREEPVYDDKCSFSIERWVQARRVEAKGASLAEAPRWPETNLRKTGNCLGCEREGAKSETYEVKFRLDSSNEVDTCEFPESKWKTFPAGKRWPAKSRVLGGGLDCDTVGS